MSPTITFAAAAVALHVLLGGSTPGPWHWVSLPFTTIGAATATAVAVAPAPRTLALLWVSGAAVLALVQIATRIVSVRTAPLRVRSVSRSA